MNKQFEKIDERVEEQKKEEKFVLEFNKNA
jgi:hypothetical protein